MLYYRYKSVGYLQLSSPTELLALYRFRTYREVVVLQP